MSENSRWIYEGCVGGRKFVSGVGWVYMSAEEREHVRELWERAFAFLFSMSRRERIKLQGGRVWWWNENKKRPTISNQIGQIVLSQGWT